MIGIYMIRNLVNNKVYIGQSIDLTDRIWHHQSQLRHNRHENTHLQRSWNKYGSDSFEFIIQEECSEETLDDRERYYIDAYDAMDDARGYNKESGGSLHKHMSEESRRKMSAAKQGMYDGDKNPMYGVHLKCSEERKAYLSQKMSGKENPMYGVHLKPTEEQRKRESERFSGEGNPFYGCKHTEETKLKMRANNKKKKAVRCVETGIEYESSCEVERQLGFDSSHINACCNGKAHTSHGYHWEFVA